MIFGALQEHFVPNTYVHQLFVFINSSIHFGFWILELRHVRWRQPANTDQLNTSAISCQEITATKQRHDDVTEANSNGK